MTKDEVAEYVSRPVGQWEKKPLIFMPYERTLPNPEKVIPSIAYYSANGCDIMYMPYARTDVIRNMAAVALLQSHFEWLIMLDCDHIHDLQIVEKLCRWNIYDPEIRIVGGLNFQRKEPYYPCFDRVAEKTLTVSLTWPEKDLFEVKMLGTGSIMIHRSVFEQVEGPWFQYDYSHWKENYYPGEDIFFSQLCVKNGIKMYVDPSVRSPHIGEQLVDETTFRKYMEEHKAEFENGSKL